MTTNERVSAATGSMKIKHVMKGAVARNGAQWGTAATDAHGLTIQRRSAFAASLRPSLAARVEHAITPQQRTCGLPTRVIPCRQDNHDIKPDHDETLLEESEITRKRADKEKRHLRPVRLPVRRHMVYEETRAEQDAQLIIICAIPFSVCWAKRYRWQKARTKY